LFFTATSLEDMHEAVAWARSTKTQFLVIGHGSNCLFPDEGIEGLVIHNKIDHIHIDQHHLTAGAGSSFAKAAVMSATAHLSGIEFGAGIPGTIGGAVIMNAGAQGQTTSDCLAYVTYLDQSGQKIRASKESLSFGYRTSSLRQEGAIILEAQFVLTPDETTSHRQKALLATRTSKQPPGRSVGSVYKNPPNDFAGRLIESCGLKGFSVGGACVSPLHANFIINTGNATAKDVLTLMELIERTVFEKFMLVLEREVCVLPGRKTL
jgi:UDP-N-acetylmuramate dehydrogenase